MLVTGKSTSWRISATAWKLKPLAAKLQLLQTSIADAASMFYTCHPLQGSLIPMRFENGGMSGGADLRPNESKFRTLRL